MGSVLHSAPPRFLLWTLVFAQSERQTYKNCLGVLSCSEINQHHQLLSDGGCEIQEVRKAWSSSVCCFVVVSRSLMSDLPLPTGSQVTVQATDTRGKKTPV